MGDFRRLIAWQKAHAFALALHAAFVAKRANSAPGFRHQILRAVDSIADNLAEGCAKASRLDLARFADSAYCSSKEVEGDLLRARAMGILATQLADDLLTQGDEVSRLCFALAKPARQRPNTDDRPDV